jgi:hypothetical protein
MPIFHAPIDLPIMDWSWASAHDDAPRADDLGFIAPLVRRRLSSLSKAALVVAHRCLAGCEDHAPMRVVFSSRHGELLRSTQILDALCAREPVSPTAFSLSVLNAMTGIFGIARADRSTATALSAGVRSLEHALLEAQLQYLEDPASPVLVIHADEPAPSAYGAVVDDVSEAQAIALLIGAHGAGHLQCADADGDGLRTSAATRFGTQAQAIRHALANQSAALAQGACGSWTDARH